MHADLCDFKRAGTPLAFLDGANDNQTNSEAGEWDSAPTSPRLGCQSVSSGRSCYPQEIRGPNEAEEEMRRSRSRILCIHPPAVKPCPASLGRDRHFLRITSEADTEATSNEKTTTSDCTVPMAYGVSERSIFTPMKTRMADRP